MISLVEDLLSNRLLPNTARRINKPSVTAPTKTAQRFRLKILETIVKSEFHREQGNLAVSKRGFEVEGGERSSIHEHPD